MNSHWQSHKQLGKLSFIEEVDQAKLDALITNVNEAQTTRMNDKAKLNNQIFNVLTAEQQQQLQQKMADVEEKHRVEKNGSTHDKPHPERTIRVRFYSVGF